MPELPEVETIRLGLQQYLVGHKIEKAEVKLSKIVQGNVKDVEGGRVTAIRRFGKGLVIDLSNKFSLAIHIKLTGQLVYRGPNLTEKIVLSKKVGGSLPSSRTHVIFHLDRGGFLYYNDLRQFGWIKIIKSENLKDISFFKDLGPEPPIFKTSDSQELTLDKFKKILGSSILAVKPLIMDQKRIGGIGNIYANDGLYDAKISPKKSSKTLSEEEVERLYNSLLKVLKTGFKYKGASELNFVNAKGEEGEYQDHSLVYGKKGQKCERCGGTIIKDFFAGRGTYYCPACQK